MNRDDLLASLHIDVAPDARVLDLDADEPTLDDVPDATIDGAVRITRRGPKAALGELAELGRILRPGGWAVMRVSTAAAADRALPNRRQLLRSLAGRTPAAPQPVSLEALGAVAVEAGLDIERIVGSGSSDTIVVVRASPDAGSIRASRPA